MWGCVQQSVRKKYSRENLRVWEMSITARQFHDYDVFEMAKTHIDNRHDHLRRNMRVPTARRRKQEHIKPGISVAAGGIQEVVARRIEVM